MALICCFWEIRVKRIERLSVHALASMFTPLERRLTSGRAFPAEGLAARLAAKKALASALFHLGWQRPFPWTAIEVGSAPDGRPGIRALDRNLERIVELNASKIFVSLSHTREIGCAVVALEWGMGGI